MEALIGVSGALVTALLAASVIGLVKLNGRVERLIALTEALVKESDEHKKDDERRFVRIEQKLWPVQ